jgi:hypothetical protein
MTLSGRSGLHAIVQLCGPLAPVPTGEKPAAISVLFIDSNLWARLIPSSQGFHLEVHTAGAKPDDVTIVTSEAILTIALQGKNVC